MVDGRDSVWRNRALGPHARRLRPPRGAGGDSAGPPLPPPPPRGGLRPTFSGQRYRPRESMGRCELSDHTWAAYQTVRRCPPPPSPMAPPRAPPPPPLWPTVRGGGGGCWRPDTSPPPLPCRAPSLALCCRPRGPHGRGRPVQWSGRLWGRCRLPPRPMSGQRPVHSGGASPAFRIPRTRGPGPGDSGGEARAACFRMELCL